MASSVLSDAGTVTTQPFNFVVCATAEKALFIRPSIVRSLNTIELPGSPVIPIFIVITDFNSGVAVLPSLLDGPATPCNVIPFTVKVKFSVYVSGDIKITKSG